MGKKHTSHLDVNWPGAWLIEQQHVQGIPEIPNNKTLFIQKFTDEPPSEPEFNKESSSLADVFEHYKPSKEVTLEDSDGVPVDETFEFSKIKDFGKEGMIAQSEMLRDLNNKLEMYADFIKRLKSVKTLPKMMADSEAKAAYLMVVDQMIAELEETGA